MYFNTKSVSLLSWERGLKLTLISGKEYRRTGRSSRGSVDWNPCIRFENQIMLWSLLSWERGLKLSSAIVNFLMVCRSSRGSVDWNIKWKDILQGKLSRSSRGSVDWNPKTSPRWLQRMVAPLVGAWIEINVSSNIIKPLESLLSWERGLKFCRSFVRLVEILSLLSWERGLKLLIHHNQFYLHLRRSSRGSVDWNCLFLTL